MDELRRVHKQALTLRLQTELLDYQAQAILTEQVKRAQLIMSKYEILTR